jgi:membrane associated rhomboid family serine protease
MLAAGMTPAAPITKGLIAANVLAFAYEVWLVGSSLVVGGGSSERLIDAGALVPVLVQNGDYWRIVTGGFLHASALHIGVNMYSLLILGRFVEAVAGAKRMAIIYAVSLVASGLAVVALAGPYDVTVGASGAIFGLFGALFAIGFKLGRPGMRLVQANLGILAVNLLITFTVPGIAVWGHVGGLVAGFFVALAIFQAPRVAA